MLTLVWSLIIFAYVSYYLVLVVPWEWYETLSGSLHVLFFNTVVGMLVYSYIRAIFTNAGDSRKDYIPPDATKEQLEAAKVKKDGAHAPFDPEIFNPNRVRFCFVCNAYKPPRAHHCRDCNVCTLAMDHHCPWVGNCVGHKNHKYFLLFLIYSTIGLSYELIMFIWRFIDGMMYYSESMHAPQNTFHEYIGTPFSTHEVVLLIMNTFITMPVTIAIVSLLVYQISCVFANQTSIEDYISGRQNKAAAKVGVRPPAWPYDFGWLQNVRQKLGQNVWTWFIPIIKPISDGYTWKTKPFRLPSMPERDPSSIFDPDSRRATRRIVEASV
jgi:hypothetical protein